MALAYIEKDYMDRENHFLVK